MEGNLSLQSLKELTEKAIDVVSEEDWIGFCKKVEEEEEENRYWENGGIVSNVIDSIIMNLGSNSESDYSESEENSSSDSVNDGDGDDKDEEDDDEELARPL